MANRTRGTSAGLDRGQIAAAAVALVDRDGLDQFSVRRLADDLGVDPMSIYHHIKGKAALLDAVSEAVLAEATAHADDLSGDWPAVARQIAHRYRDMAYRHPRVFPLLATRAQLSPVALTTLDQLVAAMRRSGLPDQSVADAPAVLFGFLNGHLLARTGAGAGGPSPVPDFDAATHPTLAALAPRFADFGSTAEFDRMLDTVLAGLGDRAVR
ncbi:TetR/AcrR family transcriptional regulator C-terminal domain-containing protein [Hamadaea sp. NPDC050747]|uniref:TetR/AcrR family transcriptional regulator n=1 Tax=Hamadaea sp. NPDC050747 TaxID=3155789 RepID=UPI0033C7D143